MFWNILNIPMNCFLKCNKQFISYCKECITAHSNDYRLNFMNLWNSENYEILWIYEILYTEI